MTTDREPRGQLTVAASALPATQSEAVSFARQMSAQVLDDESTSVENILKGSRAAEAFVREQGWQDAVVEFSICIRACEWRWEQQNPRRPVERPAEGIVTQRDNIGSRETERRIHDAYEGVSRDRMEELADDARETGQPLTRSKVAHVSHNSGENEWYTPPAIIEAAREVMGGIDLDPASSLAADQTVKADAIFTMEDNGLEQEWLGRVWLNPPYAQPLIGQFAEKLVSELEADRVTQAITLTNNATDTAWAEVLFERASVLCHHRRRVRFIGPEGARGAPLQGQMILGFGVDAGRFADAFGKFGKVWH